MTDRHTDHLQAKPPTFVEDKVAHHALDGVDFGFAISTEQPTVHIDKKLLTDQQYADKLAGLAKLVDQLFDSLVGDSTKDYIFWPNRKQQIGQWKEKINTFLNDKE